MNTGLFARYQIVFLALMAASSPGFAQTTFFNFEGKLKDAAGNPVESSNVVFKIGVFSPDGGCLLYEQQNTVDMSGSAGAFNIAVGSEQGSALRTSGVDPNFAMRKVFDNSAPYSPVAGTCAAGYTPAANDSRALKVTVTVDGGTSEDLPPVSIGTSPTTWGSSTLEGKAAGEFLQINAGNNVTQANLNNAFAGAKYTELMALINGTSANFLRANSPITFSTAQSISNVSDPVGPQDVATKNYCDSTLGGNMIDDSGVSAGTGAGKVLTWDGNKWVAQTVNSDDLGSHIATMDLDMATNNIMNLADPTSASDAATKNYVDTKFITKTLPAAPTNAEDGMSIKYDNGAGAWVYYTPAAGAADNLGDHTATSNIELGPNYISGDGDNEGISIDAAGRVGVGTLNPNSSAALEIVSTDKGFLLPRMTTAERNGINGGVPAQGLQVYNTTTNTLQYYDGTSWQDVGSGAGGVTTFNARSGAVVPTAGDYNAGMITSTATGGVVATTVQGAINELDTEKLPIDGSTAMTGDLLMGGNQVSGIGTPTSPSDATRKDYVDNNFLSSANGSVTSAHIADGTISNVDISASAAISDSKLATISSAGKVANSATTATSSDTPDSIVMRNASGAFSAGNISSSGSISAAGSITAAASITATGSITAASFSGSGSALTGLNAGNISSGVLSLSNGGTGASSQAGAANAVLPSQSGFAGRYLTTDGANVSWATVAGPDNLGSHAATTNLQMSGNTIFGNTTTSGNLTLDSTSNATKGRVVLQPSGGAVAVGTMTPNLGTSLHLNTSSGPETKMAFTTSGTATNGFEIGLKNVGQQAYLWNNENGVMYFGTNGAERMRIDNVGNVGVGTTSPGEKLDVNGNIRAVAGQFNQHVQVGDSAVICDTNAANGGKLKYNVTTGRMEYCNHIVGQWTPLGTLDTTPYPFSFNNQLIALLSSPAISNDVYLYEFDGPIMASVSGDGAPQICNVTIGCSFASSVSVNPGDAVRIRTTSPSTTNSTANVTVTVGNTVATWQVTTDTCAGSPTIGTICSQGAVYAGMFNGFKMMVTRGGCTNSSTPTCSGSADTVFKRFGTPGVNHNSMDLNNGRANTAAILAAEPLAPAAKFCADLVYGGYDDWYLPARNELQHIHANRAALGGFMTSTYYWSSTQDTVSNAFQVTFNAGTVVSFSKDSETTIDLVRCVRNY